MSCSFFSSEFSSTVLLIWGGCLEALSLFLVRICLHNGRGGCCHPCPKLRPDISQPTCVTLCTAPPSFPLLCPPHPTVSNHFNRSSFFCWRSAALLLSSSGLMSGLPWRNTSCFLSLHCEHCRFPLSAPPPPAAVNNSVSQTSLHLKLHFLPSSNLVITFFLLLFRCASESLYKCVFQYVISVVALFLFVQR